MFMNFLPYIRAETPTQAWNTAIQAINNYGMNIVDENRKLTRFVPNLAIHINNPGADNIPPGCGWDRPALDEYAEQLMTGKNNGFEYTYGEQLRAFGKRYSSLNLLPVDQIDIIRRRLKEHPTSRRAIAVTYDVLDHPNKVEVPCMIADQFMIYEGKLHLTAYFRSHDFGRAYPANIYGLWNLMKATAFDLGILPGTITTMSCSAHIYTEI